MKTEALQGRSTTERVVLAAALVLSLGAHIALGYGATRIPPKVSDEPVWVSMAINVTPPEPAPAPEPAPEPEPRVPEPERPKPVPKEPEVIQHQQTSDAPQPEAPPDPKPLPREVQGLDNSSFLPGSQSGLQVRAGNTTATRATQDTMKLEEATDFATVPYTGVATPPKIRFQPTLEVPQSVIDSQVEGRVEVLLTIDAEGKVSSVALVSGLHPDADAACLKSLKTSRWKPGIKGDSPVTVTAVPYSCRFKMAVD